MEGEKIREEGRKFKRPDRVGASKERKKKRNPGDRIGSEQVFEERGRGAYLTGSGRTVR